MRRLPQLNRDAGYPPVPFARYGIEYGYPPCCVAAFLMRCANVRAYPEEWRKLGGSGYIPCRYCQEEYTLRELVDNINARRYKCFVPFGVTEYIRKPDQSLQPVISAYLENQQWPM